MRVRYEPIFSMVAMIFAQCCINMKCPIFTIVTQSEPYPKMGSILCSVMYPPGRDKGINFWCLSTNGSGVGVPPHS